MSQTNFAPFLPVEDAAQSELLQAGFTVSGADRYRLAVAAYSAQLREAALTIAAFRARAGLEDGPGIAPKDVESALLSLDPLPRVTNDCVQPPRSSSDLLTEFSHVLAKIKFVVLEIVIFLGFLVWVWDKARDYYVNFEGPALRSAPAHEQPAFQSKSRRKD